MRIAIVGGGVTGLVAAYDLERLTDAEIDLYEASDRLGGKLGTDLLGDLLVERGPDCFFSRKPGAMELVRELGLEDEIVAPTASEFGMVVDGALHPVERGLVNLAAPDPEAIRSASFLSDEGRARALAPQRVETDGDLSIREFFTRRYGPEFCRLVAEPILAGTHGGDPARLSMRALYPTYLEASPTPVGGSAEGWREAAPEVEGRVGVENDRGSRIADRGTTSTIHDPQSTIAPTFLSFRNGMRTLPDALAASLQRTRVHLNAPLAKLPEVDRTLVALPANRAAALLPGVGLEDIPHRSSAIVTLAFRRADVGHPLGGTGFLVPPTESFPVTGATWSSEKWPGRAPGGAVLMRVFLKGSADVPSATGTRAPRPLEDLVFDALRGLLDLRAAPLLCRTDHWTDALPQYEIGHLGLIQRIEGGLPENVWLAGTSYRGVGVPDCLRQGRDAARRIAETL